MIREHELKSHSNWGIYMHLIESIWNLKKNPEPAMVTMKPLDYTNPSGNFREKKKMPPLSSLCDSRHTNVAVSELPSNDVITHSAQGAIRKWAVNADLDIHTDIL